MERSSVSSGVRAAPLPVVPGCERIKVRVTLLSYFAPYFKEVVGAGTRLVRKAYCVLVLLPQHRSLGLRETRQVLGVVERLRDEFHAMHERAYGYAAPDWANPEPAGRYNLVVVGAGTAGLISAAGAAWLLFLVLAVSEPMWATDYLAMWGLKGKTIFETGSIPRRLFQDPALSWGRPDHPLLVPLSLAALAAPCSAISASVSPTRNTTAAPRRPQRSRSGRRPLSGAGRRRPATHPGGCSRPALPGYREP